MGTRGLSLPASPLLIDGGLSAALEELGCDFGGPLWTARLIDEQPEALVAAHLAYLRAGARCVISASYQASIAGFLRAGSSRSQAVTLLRRSVAIARDATERFAREKGSATAGLVAASIGPYGAFLADGSEYRGDYAATDAELEDFHRERLAVLDASDADCLAVETIPSLREMRIIAALLAHCTKPAWIAFSCRDGLHISDGTPISRCARLLRDHEGVFAIGANCTAPQHISSLIAALVAECGDKRIIVYPNAGEVYDPATCRWNGAPGPGDLVGLTRQWIRGGASIVGGCCRVGPTRIAAIARSLSVPHREG